MTAWARGQLAFSLILLNLLMLTAALFGTWAWWSEYGVVYRVLSVLICLIVIGTLGVSVSIGVKPTRDVPWLRIGLVALGILLSCGVALLRREVQ
ncbi:hypothetical protein [Micromonospora sp. NPDC004704]